MNHTRLIRIATCAVALSMVWFAQAQFDQPANTQPWMDLKFDRKKTVRLNMPNTSIDIVIRFFSNASGLVILKDPTLTGSISLTTPKTVTMSQAFSMLSASLDLKGFQMSSQDGFLVVKAKPKATGRPGGMGMPGGMAGGPGMTMQLGGGPGPATAQARNELRVYTLEYANASSVARTINEVFGNSSNQNGFPNFGGLGGPAIFGPAGGTGPGGGGPGGGPGGGGPGGPGGGGENQSDIGDLSNLFALQGFGGRGGGQGGMRPGGMQSANQATVKASYDEYSNTVIVNAPAAQQVQIAALIKQIDRDMKQPYSTEAYTLTYASAEDLVTTVQNVLNASATKGKGGATTQSIDQRFSSPFGNRGNNGSQNSQGTVSADTRSNQLIVTTTDQNQVLVAKLIAKLDKEVPYQNSTVVLPLSNARASDLADLLNQAFSSNRSSSSRSSSSSSSSNRNSNSNNNNNRSNNSLGGATLGGGALDLNDLYVEMKDPNATAGELATDVSVQQGGSFGQFGGPTQSSSSSSKSNQTVSRDSQGRVVRTADLAGRVTIVADPNTNSLIVVGDPEAVALLKQILEQLDRIPEQVMIETMIVEASLDASSKFGLEWSFAQNKAFGNKGVTGNAGTNFGLSTADDQSGFKYTLTGGDLSVYLNAFKSDQRFKVLSTPRIFTSNNVEATINISQSIPYVTSQREDSNGNLTFNYSFQDVGIVLTVTPQISPSGTVTLQVSQTANDLQGYTSFNAPIVNQREAETTVSVQDGQTIVLGGIMRSTVSSTTNKVPLLGDLPLLGNLFRSTSKSDSKTELLVFLTPRIVHNAEDAKKIYEQQKKDLSPDLQKKVNGKG